MNVIYKPTIADIMFGEIEDAQANNEEIERFELTPAEMFALKACRPELPYPTECEECSFMGVPVVIVEEDEDESAPTPDDGSTIMSLADFLKMLHGDGA